MLSDDESHSVSNISRLQGSRDSSSNEVSFESLGERKFVPLGKSLGKASQKLGEHLCWPDG